MTEAQDAPGSASPQDWNIPALLETQAQRLGDKPLLRLGATDLSFAGARDLAAKGAGLLAAAGIRPGERVAMLCGNRIELLEIFLGCHWLGAIAVPLNTALRGQQLAHALNNSGARLLVMETVLLPLLASLDGAPPALETVWTLDGVPADAPAGYCIVAAPREAAALPLRLVEPSEPSAILYTSGTTGPSKGVLLPAAYFHWYAVESCRGFGVGAEDVLFNTMPLFHINALGSFLMALAVGARCEIGQRFSASRFWQQAAQAGATFANLLGAMASLLMAQPPSAADRAHKVRRLFAPDMSAEIWPGFVERFGVTDNIMAYGSTECGNVMWSHFGATELWHTGHVGPDRPRIEARVADDFDVELPPGKAGELLLRAAMPFAFNIGYFGMPDATIAAWRNLWFHTGDLVSRDEHGIYRFLGRKKEMIRRRGENISAWEVEQALLTHARVADVAAFAVPSAAADEEVMTTIILTEGESLDPLDLIRHLEPRLAYFAIPRFVEFVTELPLTESGKIRRAALRERGVTAATWDREASGYVVARGPRV